jgi:hypothetical protein
LFLPPPDQPFTQLDLPAGGSCFGFNATDLAGAFTAAGPMSASPSDLILNNQIGGLSVGEKPGTLTAGATRAVDFIFGLPYGAEVLAPVKIAPIAGSA